MVATRQTTVIVRHRGRDLPLSAWFRDTGRDLILFVHGLGCSKVSWRAAWSASEIYGYALLAIDLPGFGASPLPDGFSYDLAEQAELLAGVIDAHASRRTCLVAHSMGGSVAMLLPQTTARRLDSVVLVEGRLLRSSCGIAAEAAGATIEGFEAEVYPRFRRRVASDRRAAFDLDRADEQAFYLSSRSLIAHTGGAGLVANFAALTCRKTFVFGADNAHLDELKSLDAGAVRAVANAGHFVMNDNPRDFYRLLAGIAGDDSRYAETGRRNNGNE
ncbi:MAG: alpha/beta fold hydrolase [Gammaproteobacteria bacterium]